jgi:hypothetical protein
MIEVIVHPGVDGKFFCNVRVRLKRSIAPAKWRSLLAA